MPTATKRTYINESLNSGRLYTLYVEGDFTCFTLAAMQSVSGEVTLLAMKELQLSEKESAPERSSTLKVDDSTSSPHLVYATKIADTE